jgi:hypothetical protein
MAASVLFDLQLTWAITLGEIKAMSCALSPGEPQDGASHVRPGHVCCGDEITALSCNGLHFDLGVSNITGLSPD